MLALTEQGLGNIPVSNQDVRVLSAADWLQNLEDCSVLNFGLCIFSMQAKGECQGSLGVQRVGVSRAQCALLNLKHSSKLLFRLSVSGLVQQFDSGDGLASQHGPILGAEVVLVTSDYLPHFRLSFGVPVLEAQLLRTLDRTFRPLGLAAVGPRCWVEAW